MKCSPFVKCVGIASTSFLLLACFATANAWAAYTTSFGVPNAFYDPTNWSLGATDSTYQEWNRKTVLTGSAPDATNPHGYDFSGSSYFSPGSPTHGAHAPFAAFFPSSVDGGLLTSTGTDNYYMLWHTGGAPPTPYSGGTADIFNYGSGGAGEGTNVIVQVGSSLGISGAGAFPSTLRLVDLSNSPISGGANGDASITLINGYIDEEINIPGQGPTTVNYTEHHFEFFLPGYFGDFRVEWDQDWHSTIDTLRVDSLIGLDLDESVPAFSFPPTEPGPGSGPGAAIPEPASATALLLLVGLVGVARRRQQRRACLHA